MRPPKVTVIIPTYNRAHYLGASIQSVLDQTCGDFELLVVDDGSTDRTQEVLLRFQEDRLRYLAQEHRGISAALNTGIRSARGAYIARLDSDDIWLPDMLAVQVAVLDGRPDIGLVYAKAQGMDKDGNALPTIWGIPERYPGDSLRSMLYDDCTCNITIVVRRACFDHVGLFDEALQANEDWDMWLRVATRYRFAYVDRVVARFRWHGGNHTGPLSPYFADAVDGRVKVLDKAFRAADFPPALAALIPIAYRNVYTAAGLRWLGAREFRKASRSFWRAICTGPNPTITLARIIWFMLVGKLFNRFLWGRRFVQMTTALRRHWRNRKSPALRP